ncbi:uncharacterized protein N7515_003023 [Penicillium bovifimosum]|uniref:Uncharacterized protein n=1 Tax=Penicillium bovifimosum TaxID=126998 RepID=A0A9W9HCL9_9EURO|nr:uncharacterized protein N7515_003023 [Penicillium bovifimosum]KAJ5144236.1 hypothetical protein N7515_003023 [Penicillium bovifimosum]
MAVYYDISPRRTDYHQPSSTLDIEFEDLFCRQPVPPEHNILELSPDRLGRISSRVWTEGGLYVRLVKLLDG